MARQEEPIEWLSNGYRMGIESIDLPIE
jgi:hypothetical protein